MGGALSQMECNDTTLLGEIWGDSYFASEARYTLPMEIVRQKALDGAKLSHTQLGLLLCTRESKDSTSSIIDLKRFPIKIPDAASRNRRSDYYRRAINGATF